MPAVSEKQRELMAIAEHHPSEVSAKNKGVLDMSQEQLHDYASTKKVEIHPKKDGKHEVHHVHHDGTRRKVGEMEPADAADHVEAMLMAHEEENETPQDESEESPAHQREEEQLGVEKHKSLAEKHASNSPMGIGRKAPNRQY